MREAKNATGEPKGLDQARQVLVWTLVAMIEHERFPHTELLQNPVAFRPRRNGSKRLIGCKREHGDAIRQNTERTHDVCLAGFRNREHSGRTPSNWTNYGAVVQPCAHWEARRVHQLI